MSDVINVPENQNTEQSGSQRTEVLGKEVENKNPNGADNDGGFKKIPILALVLIVSGLILLVVSLIPILRNLRQNTKNDS